MSGVDGQDDDGSGDTADPSTEAVIGKLLERPAQSGKSSGRRAERITKRARRRRQLELMRSDDLITEGVRRDLVLKERVAIFALGAVTVELIVANTVFVVYAWIGEHWKLPTAAINVWLGATVVQVIGILYVIAHYLFPRSGTPLSR